MLIRDSVLLLAQSGSMLTLYSQYWACLYIIFHMLFIGLYSIVFLLFIWIAKLILKQENTFS